MADTVRCDVRLRRIIVLGVAFMLLFSSFHTGSMVEKIVLDGAKEESNGTFQGDGYTSLAIVYAVVAVSNWAAPCIVELLGPAASMLAGAMCYLLFILSFLKPMTATLYAASVLVGIGAAVMWTAQGTYLSRNSDTNTISRNTGIFWTLLQMSLFLGNVYVYFVFGDQAKITASSRTTLFVGLSSVAVVGIIFFMMLLCMKGRTNDHVHSLDTETETSSLIERSTDTFFESRHVAHGPLAAFKRSAHLLMTPEMLLLSVSFAYTGLELTYFSGVFGTMTGNTQAFGADAKRYMGLTGLFIGIGEVLGGIACGLFGKRTVEYGRGPIIILGFLAHMICFFLSFIFFSDNSPLKESAETTFCQPNVYATLMIAFLFGLGDSSYNTQIVSILGDVFKSDSSSAFALYQFIQSVAAAAGFFYSTYLLLKWQLLILAIGNFIAVLSFFKIDWRASVKATYYRL